jgi:hypothetical protein
VQPAAESGKSGADDHHLRVVRAMGPHSRPFRQEVGRPGRPAGRLRAWDRGRGMARSAVGRSDRA